MNRIAESSSNNHRFDPSQDKNPIEGNKQQKALNNHFTLAPLKRAISNNLPYFYLQFEEDLPISQLPSTTKRVHLLNQYFNHHGNDGLGCRLCEKYKKKQKILMDNEVHKQTQQFESQQASQSQLTWIITQTEERTKHEIAIQKSDLICSLSELDGVSYKDDTATLEFLRHVVSYLHEEVIEKGYCSLFYGAKYERCSSIANRIQTNGHSRIMIETLDVLMNVRSPFPDDLRGNCCREIIEKAYNTWNGKDENRPINRTKLLLDIPDDYVPSR
ncbi:unnamed protein product [Rotaria sordida]|uniref:Uncharacterized protein n=1 Tax=Rotaria sordida TaxID=392033 RepID=A0A819FX31_9BILA|nr:unnamed protein product [Rotaria sordida]